MANPGPPLLTVRPNQRPRGCGAVAGRRPASAVRTSGRDLRVDDADALRNGPRVRRASRRNRPSGCTLSSVGKHLHPRVGIRLGPAALTSFGRWATTAVSLAALRRSRRPTAAAGTSVNAATAASAGTSVSAGATARDRHQLRLGSGQQLAAGRSGFGQTGSSVWRHGRTPRVAFHRAPPQLGFGLLRLDGGE